MLPWSADLAGRIDEHVITANCCAATRSATRTSGRCSCTCRRATTTSRAAGTRRCTSSRATPGTWPCGGTGPPSGSRSPRPPTRCSPAARRRRPIVVYVDAWTSYGGSQFVDSPGTGRYHSYLCDEVVPWVDARYRTLPDAAHRAIMGKSSGGFGAMITPMLRPDLFGALATHAGDSLYEYCYIPEFATAVRHLRRLRRRHLALVGGLRVPGVLHQGGGHVAAVVLGVAACFSANEDGSRGPAVRPGDRSAPARRVAALAGLGPGADGASARGRAAGAAGDLDRRGHQGRVVPRPRRRRRSAPRSGTSGWRRT